MPPISNFLGIVVYAVNSRQLKLTLFSFAFNDIMLYEPCDYGGFESAWIIYSTV